MSINHHENFNRLCAQSGIVDAYYDIQGGHHVASVEARQSMLAALGIAAADDAQVSASLEASWRRDWQQVIPPVLVYREDSAPYELTLTLDATQLERPLRWCVTTESGELIEGDWHLDNQQAFAQAELDGRQRLRLRAQLPAQPGLGYHRLRLQLDQGPLDTQFIVAPQTCYLPPPIANGARCWGVSLQLYALRSRRNWGIGDFTDLRAAIGQLAPLGVDCIGLSPLHALFPHRPEDASPYSPSSRDFINPLYLDVEAVDEFQRSDTAGELISSDAFQARLRALRATEQVDYSGVWALKLEAFEVVYDQFRKQLADGACSRVAEFRNFQAAAGEALYQFALFEALQAFFHRKDPDLRTWQQWPAAFRDPHSRAVADWAAAQREAIEFHQYLQWQAELQLAQARRDCQQHGMQIGLYNDLAVGNERFSAACWTQPEAYALDVGIGAPPDDFSPAGQSWGLPPQLPERLRAVAYQPFIRSLRANMRHAGALRIDHVMGLMRLYWVPDKLAADQGTYLGYPFGDLLAILALESQRQRCLVIGEDLGTVPDEVRHALWLNKILSYRILMFEKDWQAGSFKPPRDYPPLALCASGSHDLPTLRGYWCAADLELRETLRLYPHDDMAAQQRELRQRDRLALLAALAQENLLDADALQQARENIQPTPELLQALQVFLARSQACLQMVQLEDLLGQLQQVNLPGTIDEYPNWRLKVAVDIEDWSAQDALQTGTKLVNRERSNPGQ